MPHITRELLRRRAEHNEGLISTLEEISLHQEELEQINETLGLYCRKIKILYLQNNIIPKIENLVHLKDLEYLNLALNNISKIEGLQNCEFLRKLDLTCNFVDLDELRDSIDHLSSRDRLRELYMMGNPSQVNWPGFESYVIAKLPQLHSLDGKEISRSMQITANQKLPQLEEELIELAAKKRQEKVEKLKKQADDCDEEIVSEGVLEHEKLTENTPEVRVEIYKELAQQKKEKEDRDKANRPRERDYEKEQKDAISSVRTIEESADISTIKQKNEGGWEFFWDEEKSGNIILEVMLPKHLDTSLIDVDIHPNYVSIIVKSKVLRLHTPSEVKVSDSKCQRSKITGSLKVLMPKVNSKDMVLVSKPEVKTAGKSTQRGTTRKIGEKKLSLQEQMLMEAMNATKLETPSKAVDIHNIIPKTNMDDKENPTVSDNRKPTEGTKIEEL